MANEITFAQTEGVFSQDYMLNREALITALHPAANVLQTLRRASLIGRPSDSQRFPKPPVLAAQSVADGVDLANTAYTPTQVTLTVGEIGVMVTPSDLNVTSNIFGGAGQYGNDLAFALVDKLTTDITALFSGFSTSVGSTGVALTETNFVNAQITLRANDVARQLVAVVHPRQYEDMVGSMGSVLTAAGTTGTSPREVTNDLSLPGSGMTRDLYGVLTVVNSTVPTANAAADRSGGMYEIGTTLGYVTKWDSRLETERDASLRATEWVATAAYAVGELDDARGVQILSENP